MQHFILDQDISGSEVRINDKELLHQMKSVLRFRVGDSCMVLDGRGRKAKGVLEEFHKKGAKILLSEHMECERPVKSVRLFCAISKKPSTFELIVQKATELGVSEIVPLVTERCQVKELRKMDRLKLIVREASEQSERCFIPELGEVDCLSELLTGLPSGLLLVGDVRKEAGRLVDFDLSGDVNLIIGPEGGLSDEELKSIEKAGGFVFVLGENVLRMETAAIVAVGLVGC